MPRKKKNDTKGGSNKNAKGEAKAASNQEPIITRELKMIIVVVVILALVFLASYYLFSGIGKVEYQGIIFTKSSIGEIPIYRYTYHFKDPRGEDIINYNFYVRNNPAKNNIPITQNTL